jgi:hypothetical protein
VSANLVVSRFRTHIPEDLGFREVRAINAGEAGAEDASRVSTLRPLLCLKVYATGHAASISGVAAALASLCSP